MSDKNVPHSYSPLFWIIGIAILSLSITPGCKVGPNFKPPQTQVPDSWVGAEPNTLTEQTLINWWATFGDPNLTSLVERAVQSNLDLKQAGLRILQARASRGIVAGGSWPSADAIGSATRGRAAGGTVNNLYQVGFDALWELDFFGGQRRDIEAAEADVQAVMEDRGDVQVTLTAEVALNYIDLRGYQQQIAFAEKNLQAQKHTAELTKQRFPDFVSGLDVANADALVATTASQIPLLETSARQTIYTLSILLGLEPAALLDELNPPSTIPVAPPRVPVGVPSELLRRRPDIRRAEAQIHAATARIGVATADLFPKISLSGSAGYESNQSRSLTDWENRVWSVGPSLDWPIFSGGSIHSNIELQKVLQQETFITYRQTVLTALQDVENALIASSKEQQRHDRLVEAVNANQKAVALATQLYTEGLTNFLNVLQAQRSLYTSEDDLVQSTRNVSAYLVSLYKALGGGWTE